MPLAREIEVWLDETLSVSGRRDLFLSIARPELAAFEAQWRSALAEEPDFQLFVDGREGASLSSVSIPGGTIAERVRPIGPIVKRAVELFDLFTKVVTGDFKSELSAFINNARRPLFGAEADPGDQVFITSVTDFTWKGEVRGFTDVDSSGFTKGLFASIAAILKREFPGALTPIRFAGRTVAGQRLPGVLIG